MTSPSCGSRPALTELRDMDDECEHGEWGPHERERYTGEWQGICPGGREVTIDYGPAQIVPVNQRERKFSSTAYFLSHDEAHAVVDAALGIAVD